MSTPKVVVGDTFAWANMARRRAYAAPVYDGDIERNQWIISSLTWYLKRHRAVVILSRDNMVHLGWWKNIEYQNCLHLSISFREWGTWNRLDWSDRDEKKILDAVFGIAKSFTWWEPAYTPEGKNLGVQHWRLFYAPDWITPIHPKGEPHTLNVPAGWTAWTDAQAGLATPNFNADIASELPLRRVTATDSTLEANP